MCKCHYKGCRNDNGMKKVMFLSSASETDLYSGTFSLAFIDGYGFRMVEMIEGSNKYHTSMFYQFSSTGGIGDGRHDL